MSAPSRSEEHTSERPSPGHLVCRLLLGQQRQGGDEHGGGAAGRRNSPVRRLLGMAHWDLRQPRRLPPVLHSLPTRRSSDLEPQTKRAGLLRFARSGVERVPTFRPPTLTVGQKVKVGGRNVGTL